MQTFLPSSSFARSARVLDQRRLGKQRVEALQIYRALTRPTYGWQHHPAVKMWRGYEEALVAYGVAICDEWIRRGHADTVRATLVEEFGREPRTQAELRAIGLLPPWIGKRSFHAWHRSKLMGKDPAWYRRWYPDVPAGLPDAWPV
jgi:hypothetical protein